MSPLQLLKKSNDQQVERSLASLFDFLIPSVEFLALLVAGRLFYWASLATTLYLERPGSARRRLQLKIVSFCCFLFVCFMRELFADNLSTENVVVETDELLFSKEKLLNTKKEFCFPEKSSELDLLKNVSLLINFFIVLKASITKRLTF